MPTQNLSQADSARKEISEKLAEQKPTVTLTRLLLWFVFIADWVLLCEIPMWKHHPTFLLLVDHKFNKIHIVNKNPTFAIMPARYSDTSFLTLGLSLIGFSQKTIARTCRKTNIERFKDSFYASPKTCEQIFDDIHQPGETLNPKYFLLSLYYLKKYPTKHGLAAFLDTTQATALKWTHIYVNKIHSQKQKKYQDT